MPNPCCKANTLELHFHRITLRITLRPYVIEEVGRFGREADLHDSVGQERDFVEPHALVDLKCASNGLERKPVISGLVTRSGCSIMTLD